MNNKEVLEKAGRKKVAVGEMETQKINKSSWIAIIVACVLAIALICVEASLGHKAVCFGIAAICFAWASVFYFCQFFIAKRPIGVLFGAIAETLGCLIMILNYILATLGVI